MMVALTSSMAGIRSALEERPGASFRERPPAAADSCAISQTGTRDLPYASRRSGLFGTNSTAAEQA